MDLKAMQEILMERHGLDIPIHTCQRAKKRLKEWIRGNHRESYARLRSNIEGLIKGMVEIFPESERRICDVHYYRNFSKDYPGGLSILVIACNAYTKHVHKQIMKAIMKESKEAYEWQLDEHLNTGLESFNGKIEKYRHKPIFSLLEAIRRKSVQIITNRSGISKDWKGKVIPRVKLLLVKVEKESRAYRLTPIGRGIFEDERDYLKIRLSPVDIKRGMPQTKRKRDIMERRKEFNRSITLKCSYCKHFGHNKRSDIKDGVDGVLEILKGKDRPSNKEKRGKRKVGRPRKA
ncbi:hypothetical protein Cgig2_004590 [Carnegiea gigantea]|uniref:Uncharacterized protein n=1 Tax=Carnegiea gigantea TaxID=171969 RepID=A0A9Q1Q993_9CARY|nr:hypothetical protein Cgig2_004590 [Carnegiea gigantea]